MCRVGRDPQGSWSPARDTPTIPPVPGGFTFIAGARKGLRLFGDLSLPERGGLLVDIEGMEGVKNPQFTLAVSVRALVEGEGSGERGGKVAS